MRHPLSDAVAAFPPVPFKPIVMALTDQPYLPLYVDDWMNNNKLKQCSAGAHGLMISIMCILHKENTYGKLLLKQKYKQTLKQKDEQILNFASMFAKLTCFDFAEIEIYLRELITENVLIFEGDFIVCPRMVKDYFISQTRANSGRKGGLKTGETFAKASAKANLLANAGIENENGIENEINKKDGNKILIGNQEFSGKTSDWLKANKEAAIESLMMNRFSKLHLDDIYKAIDIETVNYHFKDHNHPYNYFKKKAESLLVPNKNGNANSNENIREKREYDEKF